MLRRDVGLGVSILMMTTACVSASVSTTTAIPPTTTEASSTTTLPPVLPDSSDGEPGDNDLMLVEVQVLDADDGDSLRVVLDGVEERVRLLGINAPEWDECLGDESRDSLEELVGDAAVLGLEPDDRDQFGRILAHVFATDVYVNREQVSNGLAIGLSVPNAFRDELIAAETLAESGHVGMWNPEACGERTAAEGLGVLDVEPDPPGRDEENLDGEYVVIANRSDNAIDLSGFVLRDESTANRFVFQDGYVLGAGQDVTVVSGCHPPSEGLGWCADVPVWNNAGDSALLLDPHGGVVDHYRYEGDR